jgi:hypothetical protein
MFGSFGNFLDELATARQSLDEPTANWTVLNKPARWP